MSVVNALGMKKLPLLLTSLDSNPLRKSHPPSHSQLTEPLPGAG